MTTQEVIQEEIRKLIRENWSSEVTAMIRDELDDKNSPFTKWWKKAPPQSRIQFLRVQFKLPASPAANVVQTFAKEGTMQEFGEQMVGKYRGSMESYRTTREFGNRLPKGYVPKSAPSPDKNKIIRYAKVYAKAKNLDTMAIQNRSDGQWRVYGKSSAYPSSTSKYF